MNYKYPEPPIPPCCRIIDESSAGHCPKCSSSLKRKGLFGWLFGIGKILGCIQPKCENYYKKGKKC